MLVSRENLLILQNIWGGGRGLGGDTYVGLERNLVG